MLTSDNKMTPDNVASTPHPLPTAALDYDLPAELIATRPAEPRDAARLLVVRRGADTVEHASIRNLPDYLASGDLMVFNTTAVAPARLLGRRADSGGRVEGLFLSAMHAGRWRVMLRSNGRLRAGQRLELLDQDQAVGAVLTLIERQDDAWIAAPDVAEDALAILEQVGRTPLPPYILRARGEQTWADALDRTWYQTIYADPAQRQSVAAPTAGLHFTSKLLQRLHEHGVSRAHVVLHVGPGTFKPVEAETLDAHPMHAERYIVSPQTIRAIQAIRSSRERADGSTSPRVIAVGTTTVRALESLPHPLPSEPTQIVDAETRLLIQPGHVFRCVDGLLTNFHLPRSTLLALVGAMLGLDRMKAIYAEAIRERYRFYSYGDAMLILP